MNETGVFWLRVATVLYAAGMLDAVLVLLRKKSGRVGHTQADREIR